MKLWFGRSVSFISLTLLLGLPAFVAQAVTFQAKQVKLEHPANGKLLKLEDNPWLLVSGHNSEHRWLSAVNLVQHQAQQIPIPTTAQFFQQARLAGYAGGQLVMLTTDGVVHYQFATNAESESTAKGQWKSLFASSSMYRVVDDKRLNTLKFAVDVNQDKLSDFLLADFNAYQLWVQQADGSFRQFSLAIDAQMQAFREEPTYQARTPWLVDFNLDGRTDVAFAKDDTLQLFFQQDDGSFATTAQSMPLGVGLTPDNQAQMRGGDGRNYKGLQIKRLQRLADINADDVMDLVVQQQHYIDAMEQNYSYQIHYGRKAASGLTYAAQPDQRINTSGMQFDVRFVDLDNDQRLDFYTPAAQIGVRSIIRALIAGTANLELQFYKQQPDGSFGSQPVYRQDVTVEISIGSGQINMPLATVVKNAVGKASLVVGDGEQSLRTFAPVAAKFFSEKSTKQQQVMPKNGNDALVVDLNQDQKEDLVLPFSQQEQTAELSNQLQLLLQQ